MMEVLAVGSDDEDGRRENLLEGHTSGTGEGREDRPVITCCCPTSNPKPFVEKPKANFSEASVCNGLIVLIIGYFSNIFFEDVRDYGSITILNWNYLEPCFSPETLRNVTALWVSLVLSFVVLNSGLRVWANNRRGGVWDQAWFSAALLFHLAFLLLPAWAVLRLELPPPATLAVLVEQMRLLMKSYSYLRESVAGQLAGRSTNTALGHLYYFLFAPTLIFSDTFPRKEHIRLGVIFRQTVVFLVCIVTMVTVVGRSCLRPYCGPDGSALASWLDYMGLGDGGYGLGLLVTFMVIVHRSMIGGLVIAIGVTIALSSQQEVFAELLRFRLESLKLNDWWNASKYEIYLRNWSPLVSRWLHKYVMKELRRCAGCPSAVALLLTCLVSTIFHEYIVGLSFGYVIPIMSGYYLFGGIGLTVLGPFRFKSTLAGNFTIVWGVSCGMASFMAFYFIESNARRYCPRTIDGTWDLFVARSWDCPKLFLGNCTFM